MGIIIPFATLGLLAIVYKLYRWFTHNSIAHIPGPEPESFLLGNLPEFFQSQVGEAELKWQAEYGDVVRLKASFGENRLLVSDPKALQYIYQTSGYTFQKQPERRELSRILSGRGILWADGADHLRHRKVMLPGFAGPEAKGFVPIFFTCASQLANKWKDIIASSPDQSSVLDIPSWTSRATLDAIGEAAFDYQFGAMDNADNALGRAYTNLFTDTFGSPSNGEIFGQTMLQYVPRVLRELLGDYAPSQKLVHARATARLATSVAKSLVTIKSEALSSGKGSRDIMSLLVKANVSENVKTKLSDEEMLAQMRTLIMAGHETTANSLSWTLLELSRHPEMQDKLRHEIRATEKNIGDRGDTEFTPSDFDAMPYLTAILKETLRYHSVAYNSYRRAAKDDILPLSKPITTTSGQVITEIPIPAGLRVMTSISGYHRNKDIFGYDADKFNPERWLESRVKRLVPVGVYSNLLCFAGGVRSCIGWRFAIMEMQAFLVELVNSFEFSLTPEAQRIRREACLVMVPTVEGQVEKGAQLPLRVRVASRED